MYICSQCVLRSLRPTRLSTFTQGPGVGTWPRPHARGFRRGAGKPINSPLSGGRYEDERNGFNVRRRRLPQRTSAEGFQYRYEREKARQSDGPAKRYKLRKPTPTEVWSLTSHNGPIARQIRLEARKRNLRFNIHQRHRELKIRWSSLYPYSVEHRRWRSTFPKLWRSKRHGRGITVEEIWKKVLFEEDDAKAWVKEFQPDGGMDAKQMSEAWENLPRKEKSKRWPYIIQSLLHTSPRDALNFLLATNCHPWPPFRTVSDCFRYLEAFHYDELTADAYSNWFYRRVLQRCYQRSRFPLVHDDDGLQIFLEHADHSHLCSSFAEIIQWNLHVSADTLLCFVDSFAKLKDAKNALRALRRAVKQEPELDLNADVPKHRICQLLKLDKVTEVDGARYFEILPRVLKLGFQPTRDVMNLIMKNTITAGDPQMVGDVAQYMSEEGHEFDGYTYVFLIKAAVKLHDTERLDRYLREVVEKGLIKGNPFIMSQSLHAYSFNNRRVQRPKIPHSVIFHRMLNLYRQEYDVLPLEQLGIIPPGHRDEGVTSPPTTYALYMMIEAYLRKLNHPSLGGEIFTRFQKLVEEGHEDFGRLAETDFIYNAFLACFSRNVTTTPLCVKVVEQMLTPLPPSAILRSEGNRPIQQSKPTVRTWTLLICTYMFRGQVSASEKITELMAKQGVRLNKYSMNAMTTGYAKMGMVHKVIDNLVSMKKDSMPIDSHTVRAVRRLKNPKDLADVLDYIDELAATKALNHATNQADILTKRAKRDRGPISDEEDTEH